MSILIKGMKMPTSCSVCPMLEGDRMDGLCHAASKWLDDDEHWTWYVYPEGDMDDSKPCNCPLVEIQPHGDLIDREEVKRSFAGILCERKPPIMYPDWNDAVIAVCIAPTIIPADPAEEGEA